MIRREEKYLQEDGSVLIITKGNISPFSWMKYIIISESDWRESGKEIVAHEQGHIQAGHFWDILLVGITLIFHWFNPAVWLLKQELQNLHEYEADEHVLRQGIDTKKYQLLLIKKAVGSQRFTSMANSFSHSKLKKRITMMLKSKSHPWVRVKYLYILPLTAVMVTAFAHPKIAYELERISVVKISEIKPVKEIISPGTTFFTNVQGVSDTGKKDVLYMVDDREVTAEDMKRLPMSSIEVVSVHMQAGTTGANQEKEGTVRVTTYQEKPVQKSRVQVVPELDLSKVMDLLDNLDLENLLIDIHIDHEKITEALAEMQIDMRIEEALNQINLQELADLSFNQKELESIIQTKLGDLEEKLKGLEQIKINTEIFDLETKCLILIDGREVSQQEMERLDPETFESVHIYKEEEVVKRYGEKGRKGVIDIKTKG
ncbi:MAG: M56 family metallopeptidase [Tannerellaceae bacterium]|nr:M56 family metallopeptidase [Tannerellaceae bacterium]